MDHKFLRDGLEIRDKTSGFFPLLVADSPDIAMRGLDYRAPTHGLLLLISKSFSHRRQASQALYRVGRHGDSFSRYRVDNVPLIDKKLEEKYKADLNDFILSKKPRKMVLVQKNLPALN